MKKDILFIIPKLCIGGAEKSLISLLNIFDFSRYNANLLLFRKEGAFLENVPEEVCVSDLGEEYLRFDASALNYIKYNLAKLNLSAAVNRVKYSHALSSNDSRKVWNCMKKVMPPPSKHYDVAIAYLEQTSTYYCADCVDADIKIGYVHSDYRKFKTDKKLDLEFFKKLDYIVTISAECEAALKEAFPEIADRFKVIENITSPDAIKKLSCRKTPEFDCVSCKKILTVSRIDHPKGYDMAVEAAEILDKKGYDFKWFAVGKGNLMPQIQQEISKRSLQDKFILLGEKPNPYPYMNGCDIYVQPSYFEGKSIAIDEAKVFAKPIVCTSFPTVYDQLTDGETALLAQINAQSIAEKIEVLLNDDALCTTLSDNLKKEKAGNEEEIDKFYMLLEGKL